MFLPEAAAEDSLMLRIRQCLAISHGQVLEQPVEVKASTRYPAGLVEKVWVEAKTLRRLLREFNSIWIM